MTRSRTMRGAFGFVLLLPAVLAGLLAAAWAGAPAPDLAAGKRVYADKCLRCHGVSGRGDGPRAESLERKPLDYTDKRKMDQIADGQLRTAILEGKPPMPAYKGKMSEKELQDVIAYIRTFGK